jgi:hypothetical protein
MMTKAKGLSISVAALISVLAATAHAQDGNTGTGTGDGSGSGGTTTTTTTTAPAGSSVSVKATTTVGAKPADDDALTDHEKVVGRFAIGYLGVTEVPLPTIGAVPTVTQGQPVGFPTGNNLGATVSAPVIGARYWLTPRFGIDGGIGFGWSTGSDESVQGNTTTTTDRSGRFGFLLHGGVPIALVSGKHYTFEVIPEFNVGFGTTSAAATVPPGAPNTVSAGPNASASGFRLDIGARAGAEIHFGFIGVPQLALQATVGLNFQTASASVKREGNSQSTSTTGLGTTVQADPWALFTKNIAALYYF